MDLDSIRLAAEADLEIFIKLVAPERLLGHCHQDVIRWWEREEAKSHQLLLFPRDHMKSALIAYRVAQYLAKDPTLRILYISSTSNLAEKQLGFIKNILTSDTFRRYWPDHVHPEEGKRTRWRENEISLDHPSRVVENIREPSIFTGGLTTSLTGLHCDIAVLDDVVVFENAYTGEGRTKVTRQYSLLSSIEGADAKEWVVGTRYHPKDLYNDLMQMEEDIYDEKTGDVVSSQLIYEVYERAVEDRGDGNGNFLWPRQRRKDGKWFGFDNSILSRKRGQYLDRTQFRAQYYNDPSDPDNQPISYDKFQYYEKKFLTRQSGLWYYKDRRLNLMAAMDLAFTKKEKSDFTAIVVIGVDYENNVYILDVDRFKTDRISEYFDHLFLMVQRWDFRKIRIETTAAQSIVARELKENYIKPNGLSLKVEEYKPTRIQGSKEERLAAILEPRYENLQIFHYRSGAMQLLEDELVALYPPHDDIKDALATAIEGAIKPSNQKRRLSQKEEGIVYHPRFGGRSH